MPKPLPACEQPRRWSRHERATQSAPKALFREAIDGIAKTQFELFTAPARLAFARFLLEQKRAADARDELAAARSFFSDPLAFRRRDEIDVLLRQCDAVRA